MLSLVGACTDFEAECLTFSVLGWVGPPESHTRTGISKHVPLAIHTRTGISKHVPLAISAGTGIPKHATNAIRPSSGNSKYLRLPPPPVTQAGAGPSKHGADERGVMAGEGRA